MHVTTIDRGDTMNELTGNVANRLLVMSAAAQLTTCVASEVTFIDPGVSDIRTLLDGMRPGVEPILLDAKSPAIEQIAFALRNRRGLDAVHIIAHGAPGEVSFSAGRLDSENLREHAHHLAAIGGALSHGGKLLLWSCNTALGERGGAFVKRLGEAAGAPVAAATGLVGNISFGGAWQLDRADYPFDIGAPLTASGIDAYQGLMTTYTWTGSQGGNWDSNFLGFFYSWSPNGYPGRTSSTDVAVITSGTVTLDRNITIASLSLSSGATLIDSGYTLSAGGITDNGKIIGAGTIVGNLSGSGTVTASGGVLDLSGGTLAGSNNFTISSGGTLEFSETASISAVTLSAGQTLEVGSGGNLTISGTEIVSGGTLIDSGGTLTVTSGVVVQAGGQTISLSIAGTETVSNGGVASNTTVLSGGLETISSGGTASNTTVNLGGTETVSSGGKTSGASVSGNEKVYGSAVGDAVFSGGSQTVSSGGITSSTSVQSGGTEAVLSSGNSISATVYGSEIVSAGGTTTSATVLITGTETVYGSSISDIINNNGVQLIESGGSASNTTIETGGSGTVLAGGKSTSAHVYGNSSSPGTNLFDYGSTVGAQISAYGSETVYSGGVASATTVSSGGTLVLSGGTVSGSSGSSGLLLSGGIVSGSIVQSGATLVAASGATLSGLGVASGVTLEVSGGVARATTVGNGGTIDLLGVTVSGGTVSGTTLLSGATEKVDSGSIVSGVIVSSGVTLSTVFYGAAGGTTSATTILNGGKEVVYGSAVADTVSNGGSQFIGPNGVASGTIVQSGGTEVVSAAGTTTAASVSGIETVYGSALGDKVYLSGAQTVSSGGVASGTILSGGIETISSGGVASSTVISSGGIETISSGGVASSTTVSAGGKEIVSSGGTITSDTVNSGGTLVMSGGTASAVTLNSGGSVDLTAITYSAGETVSVNSSTGQVFIKNGATSSSTSLYLSNYTGATFTVTNDGSTHVLVTAAPCYLRGTRILMPTGERRIEDLKIGDQVVTRFGGIQRIKWIGRHTYSAENVRNDLETIPVHIRAGALDDDLPARDLYVSPGHSMLIGGTLVLAKSLVNGITVTQGWLPGTVDYFQPELDTHDCIVAEGAWSETFADGPGLRDMFHNRAEFDQMFPNHRPPDALVALCAPRPERGAVLAAALQPIVERAGAGIASGPLRGFVDRVDGSWKFDGWAQDADHPELPVLLEVLLADKVIGTVLACDFRKDLFDVFGHGNSSFVFESPVKLRPELLRTLEVRRASDGASVLINENIRPRAEAPVQHQAPERESAKPRLSLVAGGSASGQAKAIGVRN
jgi:autotransporter passenger strand-loop-strand repeat protein